MGDERWIHCKVFDGIFSDEWTIELQLLSGVVMTVYVPKKYVKKDKDGDAGKLLTVVTERDGGKWAMLPTSSRDTIPVNDDLVAV